MFKPDYTHNHRGFNRFADVPTDLSPDRRNPLDKLPEWKMRSINAPNVTGYYWPRPLEDRVYRKKTEPFNENTQLIQFNAYARMRDPFYNRAYDLTYDRPAEGDLLSPYGGSDQRQDADRWLVPPSLLSVNTPRPRGHRYFFPPTKEETTNERLPDNYNTTLVPRAFHVSIRGSDAYRRQSKERKNGNTINIQDRANTCDAISNPNQHRKNLQELTLREGIDVIKSDRINITDAVHENTPRVHHGRYGKNVREHCPVNADIRHMRWPNPIERIRYGGAQARPLRERDYILDHSRPHYKFSLPKNPNDSTAPRGRLQHSMNTIGSLPPFAYENQGVSDYIHRIAMMSDRKQYKLRDPAIARPVLEPKYLIPVVQ